MAKKATRRKAATGGKAPKARAANDNAQGRRKWTPKDVYQEVTDRILAMLDEGTVPWHNPIRGAGGSDWPKNLASGKNYRGVNVFLLAMTALSKGYDSPYWVTFRQAKERGGQVKKGEKSTAIVFWKKLLKDDEEVEIDPATGKPTKPPFVLRFYPVFNAAAQCDGLAVPDTVDLSTIPEFVKLEEAERIVREYPAPQPHIEHRGTRAGYSYTNDRVVMPVPERFEAREDYYGTLFHELVHSTGVKGRCDRGLTENPPPFGSPDYTKEELAAEMGAAFLNAVAGILPQTIAASASYIDGWRKKIRADKTIVVQAAGQAQRAADFILGVDWEAANNDEPADPPALPSPREAAESPQSDSVTVDGPEAAQTSENAPEASETPAAAPAKGTSGPQLDLFG